MRRGSGESITPLLALFLVPFFVAACGAKTGVEIENRDGGPDGSNPEFCNGQDEDGDGRIDEDVPYVVRCGRGACSATAPCVDGSYLGCSPGTQSPESCNGIDDDCDGSTDENLELAPFLPAIEIREGAGGGDECGSCRWALDPTLAPIDGGYLAFWRLGISGGNERPNFFGRRLSTAGEPLGPVRLLTDEIILEVRDIDQNAEGVEGLFEVTVRRSANDVPAWLKVERDGSVEISDRPYALAAGCQAAEVGQTVWNGRRLVSACWDDDAVHVVSLLPDGSDVRRTMHPLEGAAGGNVAVSGIRVGIRTYRALDGGRDRSVFFMSFDGVAGATIDEPRRVDLAYAPWARLIGNQRGWHYWVPNDGPSEWQLLTIEGDPGTLPEPFEDSRQIGAGPSGDYQAHIFGSSEILNLRQSAGEAGPLIHVEVIDDNNGIVRGWSGPNPGTSEGLTGSHGTVDSRGDIHIVWHGGFTDNTSNEVFSMVLGCPE